MKRWIVLLLLAVVGMATPATAQDLPKLTGRVVDAANIIPDADEAALTVKLEQLETRTSRQLVVATIPSLGKYDIAEYGFRLGEAWRIGQAEADNGAILLVAPNDRRVRVEVAPGLEGILTDAFSGRVIQDTILPRFRANDFPGGINAGVDALIAQLQAPPELAERGALEAAQARARESGRERRGGSIMPLFFWLAIFFFVLVPLTRRGSGARGRRYRRRGRGAGMDPVSSIILWEALNAATRSGRSSGWGGGGFGGSGGFGGGGGFSGGGGSFGGGGASGSW